MGDSEPSALDLGRVIPEWSTVDGIRRIALALKNRLGAVTLPSLGFSLNWMTAPSIIATAIALIVLGRILIYQLWIAQPDS